MKKYRLIKEAVPYFKENLATKIDDLDTWTKKGFSETALEEVKEPYIVYGHRKIDKDLTTTWTSGWNKEGTHFHFSIIFPSVKFHENDRFTNGRIIRRLMERIQNIIDNHYDDFVYEDSKNSE